MYAGNRPAAIYCGNGQDNGINNYQFNRAAAILRAVCGNLGVPGGDIHWDPPGIEPPGSADLHQRNLIPPELRSQRIGIEEKVLPTSFPPCLIK